MKAKKRGLAALILISLLLCALLVRFWMTSEEETAGSEATVYDVISLPLSELAAVKVENLESSFAMISTPQGVEMIAQAEQEYDQGQLRAFLYAAGHITGSRKVTDRDRFEDYGLSAPRSTVTLYRADNSQTRYQVLLDNPVDKSTYLYLEEEDAVYLIPADIAALFLRTPRDFVSHWVLPLRSQDDFAGIDSISVFHRRQGWRYALEQTEQGFYLAEPVRLRLSRVNVSGMLLTPLLQLYADAVIDTQASLAQYGLDQPDLEISLTIADRTVKVLLLAIDGSRYLMAQEGGSTIYRLDDAPMLMLSQDYTALLGYGIVNYAPGDMTELTLSAGGERLFFSFTGEGTSMTTVMEGDALAPDMQTRLLQALSQLTPVAELSEPPTAAPVIEWTAVLRTGARETVVICPLTEDLFAVSVGGTAALATDSESVRTLLALWDELQAQQRKSEAF